MAKLNGVKTLDMVNGEITKVEYGGSVYGRVEGEAKVGDLVTPTDGSYSGFEEGSIYIVVSKGNDAVIRDNDGDTREMNDNYHFVKVFRKIPTPFCTPTLESRVTALEEAVFVPKRAPKVERLKVGDKAIVLPGGKCHRFNEGNIVEIIADEKDYHPFKAKRLSDGDTQYFDESQLRKATDEEVSEALAQAELERKWAKINRKPNEYKKGDIVRVVKSDYYPTGTIREVLSVGVGRSSESGHPHKADSAELVTPVEARFDAVQ